jgi:hypothetical protein
MVGICVTDRGMCGGETTEDGTTIPPATSSGFCLQDQQLARKLPKVTSRDEGLFYRGDV